MSQIINSNALNDRKILLTAAVLSDFRLIEGLHLRVLLLQPCAEVRMLDSASKWINIELESISVQKLYLARFWM